MLDDEHSPPLRERKVSTKAKKPPPLKKRHTKPCKFFQFGRCSNTAEECNFAHVSVLPGLSLPPSLAMSPTTAVGGVCQYFAVGQCPSERACGMRHIPDVNNMGAQSNRMHIGPPPALSPTSSVPYPTVLPYPGPYSPYPPYYAPWSQGSYGEQRPAHSTGHGGYSTTPSNYRASETDSPSISISASTDSSALSRLNTPGDTVPVGALGLTGIGKPGESSASDSSVINVNVPHDYDDFNVVTEDPQFSEHAHNKHQSQVRVLDAEPHPVAPGYGYNIHSGGYPMSQTPSWDAGGMYYYPPTGMSFGDQKVTVTRSLSHGSRSKSATRKFKTKPCRYYTVENGCPNGDNCTFIHDSSILSVLSIARHDSNSPTYSGNGDGDDTHPSRKADKKSVYTEKGASQAEDEGLEDNREKKNFFPITWRVIGGGVLMGGKRPEITGGNDLRGVQPHYGESASPQEPSVGDCGNGVGFGATDKKGPSNFNVVAPRPRSSSASAPIARPNTVIGVRGGYTNNYLGV
ncbi:hypothetical protein NP233_g11838 [Leucocoprinus birnbaumii]|uniref:C3H1-type domain-containing protein n=1 Tax=Leucocoprinus birnbaumii TaxID=56174 RepID=A0AAD5VI83_9AGAR|nr:hypothetical protein NP233_g11838 [Leucocoprinus birnbaumii]